MLMKRLSSVIILTLAMAAAIAQPVKRKMPDVPLMRQIFHTNIDKAQASILKSDGADDLFFAPTNSEELNKKLTAEVIDIIDDMQIDLEINSSYDNNNKIKYLRGISEMLNSFDAGFRNKTIRPELFSNLVKAYKEAQQLEFFNNPITAVVEKNEMEVGEILVKLYPFEKNAG